MTVMGINCRGLLQDLLIALNDASPGIVEISLPRYPPWTDPDNSMPRNDLQLLIENNVKYQQEANEARRKAQGNEACRKEHKARWTKAKATPRSRLPLPDPQTTPGRKPWLVPAIHQLMPHSQPLLTGIAIHKSLIEKI